MSDELKAKLRKILIDVNHDGEGLTNFDPTINDDAISQIDQAYKRAGFIKFVAIKSGGVKINDILYIPSEDWLAHFKTELEAEKQFIPEEMYKLILEIAERATVQS